MFKTIKNGEEGFETVSLVHKDGLSCQILAEYGAALNSLKLKNSKGIPIEVIDGYANKQALDTATSKYKGVFLFPFPNRTKDGKYTFNKEERTFEINEPVRNNALHGLLYNKSFMVQSLQTFREKAVASLVYDYEGDNKAYPFPAKVVIEIELSLIDGFTCTSTITNTGTSAMPLGFGWHPYFATGSSVEEWEFSFPPALKLLVDEQMIPTGVTAEHNEFIMPMALGELHYDTGFRLKNPDGIQTFTVKDKVHDLEFAIWQEAGEQKFNYYQIYTPPSRRSVAIEPMTCPANALNSGEGLIILQAGESVSARFGIKNLQQ
jgi:aldose 1-epimerase